MFVFCLFHPLLGHSSWIAIHCVVQYSGFQEVCASISHLKTMERERSLPFLFICWDTLLPTGELLFPCFLASVHLLKPNTGNVSWQELMWSHETQILLSKIAVTFCHIQGKNVHELTYCQEISFLKPVPTTFPQRLAEGKHGVTRELWRFGDQTQCDWKTRVTEGGHRQYTLAEQSTRQLIS